MAQTPTSRRRIRPSLKRFATIGAVTVIAALAVTAPTIALTIGRADPAIGHLFWPIGAKANADRAAALLAGDPSFAPATLAKADAFSRAALRREPINVTAARTQAIVSGARGNDKATVAWLQQAEALSRRDFATQTMLIELAVSRNDVIGALAHYDRALLTNRSAADILFPILFQAASDPNVLPPLARLLEHRPEWWYDFTVRWQSNSPPPGPMFAILMAERPDTSQPRERMLAITGMRQLVAAGRSDLAARLHDRVTPADGQRAGGLVDGDFSGKFDLPPFAWDYTNNPGLAGIAERRGPSGKALTIDVSDGQGGVVAQQLLRLAPGQYRLTFRAGDIAPNGVVPSVAIACEAAPTPLAEARLPNMETPQALSFQVPKGCAAQWLRIGGTAGEDDGSLRPWISDLVLKPAG